MIGFSIIICCYNSAHLLPETLQALSNINYDQNNIELILVDNNCTDDTVLVAESIWKKLRKPFRLTVIKEPKSGLTYARKAGVSHARFEVIVFCDDDNRLSENYLSIAESIFQSYPSVAMVGGFGVASFDKSITPPDWFSNYERAYACGKQAEHSGLVTNTWGQLYGAGLCVRKELLVNHYLNYPSLLSDRDKTSLASGGDSEMCFLFVSKGYDLYFEHRMTFCHYIETKRLSWNYLHKLYENFGKAYYYLYSIDIKNTGKVGAKFTILQLFKYWKADYKYLIQYLLKGPKYSGTVKGAWLYGLTIEYFKKKTINLSQKIH